VIQLLTDLGAARIEHPGGTLLAHLERTRSRLAAWHARPALQLAGLCHAFYGTDGFATALWAWSADPIWPHGTTAKACASPAPQAKPRRIEVHPIGCKDTRALS
jgi:hypothetical protein